MEWCAKCQQTVNTYEEEIGFTFHDYYVISFICSNCGTTLNSIMNKKEIDNGKTNNSDLYV